MTFVLVRIFNENQVNFRRFWVKMSRYAQRKTAKKCYLDRRKNTFRTPKPLPTLIPSYSPSKRVSSCEGVNQCFRRFFMGWVRLGLWRLTVLILITA